MTRESISVIHWKYKFNPKLHCGMCGRGGSFDIDGKYVCEDCITIYYDIQND
jgi:hypothetical protein